MLHDFVTISSTQTNKLGQLLAEELCGGEIICLAGDLGAGKTTFTQGLLKGLKYKGAIYQPNICYRKTLRTKN
jgi:tRNA threonylcarbamoyladenosine biosynthesis protein TsaE